MLFIVSKDADAHAKEKLSSYGEVIEFYTEGITYASVSNHPDIFFCKVDEGLVYAPNTPEYFVDRLKSSGINLIKGGLPVGDKYPSSAHYNAVVTEKYFIHNDKITDSVLREKISGREIISVKQGYTRCSLLPLKNESFITSDIGIQKKLSSVGINVLFVNPEGIVLKGADYGFFGGAAGSYGDNLFLIGSPGFFPEGEKVQNFAVSIGVNIVDLYDSVLNDCGSILIL